MVVRNSRVALFTACFLTAAAVLTRATWAAEAASAEPKLQLKIDNFGISLMQEVIPKTFDPNVLDFVQPAESNLANSLALPVRFSPDEQIILEFAGGRPPIQLCNPQAGSIPGTEDEEVVAISIGPLKDKAGKPFRCTPQTEAIDPELLRDSQVVAVVTKRDSGGWIESLSAGDDGVWLDKSLFDGQASRQFVVNGQLLDGATKDNGLLFRSDIQDGKKGYLFGSGSLSVYHLQVYKTPPGCRYLSLESKLIASFDLFAHRSPSVEKFDDEEQKEARREDTGITVGAAKVYDTFTLRQMLATTANQLAGLSGFSQSQIVGAFGNLQGITRDTSYLAAQATTTPTPIVSTTSSTGATGSNTLNSSLVGNAAQSSTIVTMQCPAGTVPSINTGAVQSCTVPTLSSGSTLPEGTPGGGLATQNTGLTSSGSQNTQGNSQVQNTSQANGQTTTQGGAAGVIAPIPASTPLAGPTNIGVSASDILVEQVQLNSQITNLRMLLQGALSDQYLTQKSGQALATRAQTTLGFAVTLNPSREFKHAVAEIRIIVASPTRLGDVSIVNLLPAAKTYNVAKITSHQNAFGAGAVVDTVNIGVSTGKAKDRLYLAKDTDTVALEYPDQKEFAAVSPAIPIKVADGVKELYRLQRVGECSDVVNPPDDYSIKIFGWQFRPVLGAEYVQAGQREVFAQLALPTHFGQSYAPLVYVQTRWRGYDADKQVVGAIFKESCNVYPLDNAIQFLNPLRVNDVSVTEVSDGVLKMHASGNFFAPSISAVAGTIAIPVLTGDGNNIDLYINAVQLMQAGHVDLVQEDGRTVPLAIQVKHDITGTCECGIADVQMSAVPQPDGNSRVRLDLRYGKTYSPLAGDDAGEEGDPAPAPYVLVGDNVYGLRGSPFVRTDNRTGDCKRDPDSAKRFHCVLEFLAPTSTLRSSQTYTVRDLRWRGFESSGTTRFAPSFTSIKLLNPPPADPTKPKPPASTKYSYAITGFALDRINQPTPHVVKAVAAPPGIQPSPGAGPPPAAPPLAPARPAAPPAAPVPPPAPPAATVPHCAAADCIEIYDGPNAIALENLERVSATTAMLTTIGLLTSNTLRLVWHGENAQRVEWDLTVPKSDGAPTPLTVSPSLLNVGDSRVVTFTGGDALASGTAVTSVTFEGNSIAILANAFTQASGSTPATLKVPIPSSITQKAGYKELTATVVSLDSPAGKPTQLPIQVVQAMVTPGN